ncbi:MAG: histidine--tRNA ligase [Oscillospiraceae bacterium]
MKTTPVRGTNDFLPQQARLRDYLQTEILNVYKKNGYERITTPIIEDIENLDKSDGGENLNLIFRVLKRGDKLESAIKENPTEQNLCDMGLRYDLTLPLTRYYANNRAKLSSPLKCIQLDRVYRAERPQKGRLREFIQCDIDIIGSSSIFCEVELIDITATALIAIGLKNFKIKINDRRLLRGSLASFGFEESQLDSVCITFDKLDKVGVEGVEAELREKNFEEKAICSFCDFLKENDFSLGRLKVLLGENEAVESVEQIMAYTDQIAEGRYKTEFDLSLVRGQGYYTGTVFEVVSEDFKGSVGGGGRYDNLIGKFIGENVPAVGFSIGFERIFAILSEQNYAIPNAKKKLALLFDDTNFIHVAKYAKQLQGEYETTLFDTPKKTSKFLNRLAEQGYYGAILSGSQEITVL